MSLNAQGAFTGLKLNAFGLQTLYGRIISTALG